MTAKRTTPKQAASKDEVPLKYLECRAFRHDPKFITDRATTGASGTIVEFVRVTKCRKCGTTIRTTYSLPEFRVKKHDYDRPPNYSVKGGYPVLEARIDYLKAHFEAPVEEG